MPPQLVAFIVHHGYLAIFSLVFLQEIGVPNPVPNELVLLFSGYLAYAKVLSFPLVFLTIVAGDFIGTTLLYFVFYFFGAKLVKKAPKWFPVKKIEDLKIKITEKGMWGIYLGRLIPYARGYVSVAAGLIGIPPKIFLINVILSAITWSGGYAIAGRLLGKQWNKVMGYVGAGNMALILVVLLVAILLFLRIKKKNKDKIAPIS